MNCPDWSLIGFLRWSDGPRAHECGTPEGMRARAARRGDQPTDDRAKADSVLAHLLATSGFCGHPIAMTLSRIRCRKDWVGGISGLRRLGRCRRSRECPGGRIGWPRPNGLPGSCVVATRRRETDDAYN